MSITRAGTALVICAPSGAGKTTLIKRLREEFPNFGFSVSYTTRQPREGEVNGKDYNFVSIQDFKAQRDAGFFAEWAHVHGNFYGTPLEESLNIIHEGKSLIFDVDVQGAAQLRLNLPAAVYFFIFPPSMEILEKRLRQRNSEDDKSIDQRINNAVYEMQQAHWFDYWIVNDNLEVAYEQLRAAYIASSLLPEKSPTLLQNIIGDAVQGKF